MVVSFKYIVIPSKETDPIEERQLTLRQNEGEEDAIERTVIATFGHDNPIKLSLLLRPTEDRDPGLFTYSLSKSPNPNIRATRLSMACGILSSRLIGDVLVFRHFCADVSLDDIYLAASWSPDLRSKLLSELGVSGEIVSWLADASMQNYQDQSALREFARAMVEKAESDDDSHDSTESDEEEHQQDGRMFAAKTPLCLVCRGPSDSLCEGCQGAYFCDLPRVCRTTGWSHRCLCATWAKYTSRREFLSTFPLDEAWYKHLVTRENELSEEPYRHFLTATLGISLRGTSWWTTEVGGWAGGESDSARTVDLSFRTTYQQGFWPVVEIPPERKPSSEEMERTGIQTNSNSFWHFQSWRDYYEFRGIDLSSPVALLLTFPLTIYYSIGCYGEVPVAVARILKRPLRVHIVGVEKEINMIGIFKEIGFLAPDDLEIELVFIIRDDMLPPQCQSTQGGSSRNPGVELGPNLSLLIRIGTYGNSLDPNFDCGSGPPDMVIGLNAGLFAYESWRSVVDYLNCTPSVVGVFTDYNEHSGANCASLGGAKARESLCVNPFRQPRAMPVYSMNLPQYSNGFLYVFNEQQMEE